MDKMEKMIAGMNMAVIVLLIAITIILVTLFCPNVPVTGKITIVGFALLIEYLLWMVVKIRQRMKRMKQIYERLIKEATDAGSIYY